MLQTNSIQIRKSIKPKIQQNKTTLVQLPLTTLGQETRWAYSTPPRAHMVNLHYVSHKVHTFGFDVHTPILIIFWQKKRSKQSYWKINYPSISYFVTSTAKIIKNGSCVS